MNPHELPSIDLFHHSTPLQLRFSDVDVLGHVNNTVYFAFFDTGKAHYFTDVRGELVDWQHVDTVIANVNCAFISSIVFGEEVEVLTTCLYISDKSFKILQLIREVNTGEAKALCETVMVSIDPVTHEARSVPQELRTRLSEFEGRNLTKKK